MRGKDIGLACRHLPFLDCIPQHKSVSTQFLLRLLFFFLFSPYRPFLRLSVSCLLYTHPSCHASVRTPLQDSVLTSPLFSLYDASSFGIFFRFFLTVPTTFVFFACKILYKLGDEYQLSKNKVYPFPKMGSASCMTTLSDTDTLLP